MQQGRFDRHRRQQGGIEQRIGILWQQIAMAGGFLGGHQGDILAPHAPRRRGDHCMFLCRVCLADHMAEEQTEAAPLAQFGQNARGLEKIPCDKGIE